MEQCKKGTSLLGEIFKRCAFPTLLILAMVGAYFFYDFQIKSHLSEKHDLIARKGLFIFFVIVAAYWARKLMNSIFIWYTCRSESESAINEFIPLFKRASRIVIWTIAVIVVLSKLGVNINALVAALGVGSLAIALAAQDTISNIIAGFLIMIDRPFRVGDELQLPTGEKVKALWIGIRRSKFRAQDGSIIIVPNVDLSKSKIVNFTYGKEES